MDRKAHLMFCKKCSKRNFSREKGIVCSLTGEQADFDGYCSDFDEDTVEADKMKKYGASGYLNNGSVGGWVRFANFIVDRIVHVGIVFVIAFFLAAANVDFIYNLNKIEEILFEWSIYVVYYILFEYNFQTTLGKLITGTVVVDLEGNKPTLKAIVGRSFSRIVPFDAFSFLGAETLGWHDTWSNTRVVKKSSVKKNIDFGDDILDEALFKEQ